MTKHTKRLVVMVLGFSLFDLIAVGREDGIKFGSVKRGRERLDWVRSTTRRLRESGEDKGQLWRHRLAAAFDVFLLGVAKVAREVWTALCSHPDDNTERPAGWRRYHTSVPKAEQAAAHSVKTGVKRKGKQRKVPSDKTLSRKGLDELILLAHAVGLKATIGDMAGSLGNNPEAARASLLKRLKAKRRRQEKSAQASTKTSVVHETEETTPSTGAMVFECHGYDELVKSGGHDCPPNGHHSCNC